MNELESTVRTDGGRLFHTSGPQTEKARLVKLLEITRVQSLGLQLRKRL